ncbi:MAG: UDP-N-acetylmuramoyl-L-alanyl-D-glutamate--2,6-diaminopimelate ligase [Syntrophomonadaceae bacterium]|nr:UDP-N-acetylmuramoyl-L-alanyl-D-glutamate--2,6-diaminopimelate ligase [Syntrophomonadaceae bacterium]
MKLPELLKGLPVLASKGDLEVFIQSITYDSRKVCSGALFVAVKGFKVDGHIFTSAAARAGAAALVVQEPIENIDDSVPVIRVADTRFALGILSANFYRYPSREFRLVGVTGTNGKTTVTHLIEAIAAYHGMRTGLIGTVGNRIAGRLLSSTHTTPESLDLQDLFRKMADEKVQYVSMEVSSHALELNRVVGSEFDAAVFTNLTQDHLDFHSDMEAYFAAKAKLFSSLDQEAFKPGHKYAVINADSDWGRRLAAMSPVPVYSYSIESAADVSARDISINLTGAAFDVVCKEGSFPVKLKLTGKFSVYNALAAFAWGLGEGFPPESICQALAGVAGAPGRFEMVNCGQLFGVIIDYAHTPDGLVNILQTAKDVAQGRIITLFGCGGDRDRKKRPLMGEAAARLSNIVIVTSDNPRSEDPVGIIEEILPGIKAAGNEDYHVIPDRYQAIAAAIDLAQPGDLVIIAGKGHENYQIIGQQTLPFDDKEVACRLLKEKGYQC